VLTAEDGKTTTHPQIRDINDTGGTEIGMEVGMEIGMGIGTEMDSD
jgi:hypothetical protein